MHRRLGAALVLSSLAISASAADAPQAEALRLVEFASRAAVFEFRGELVLVSEGDRVPGRNAVLRHVSAAGIDVEFFADARRTGRLMRLQSGDSVPDPVDAHGAQAVQQGMSVRMQLVPAEVAGDLSRRSGAERDSGE